MVFCVTNGLVKIKTGGNGMIDTTYILTTKLL